MPPPTPAGRISWRSTKRSRLEQIDPRAGQIVELRFFTGLNERETAAALKISISTLKRDWNFAKAWLFDQLHFPAVE